jgi:Leucine-rich repeat (LRR) protein
LPEGLENLALLRNLALSSNPLESLPTAVTSLTALASLSSSSCQLKQLPQGLGNSQQHALAVVQASQNKLVSLPASLASATALLKLQLAENALETLPEVLVAGWFSLQELDLQSNKLKVSSISDEIGSTLGELAWICRNMSHFTPFRALCHCGKRPIVWWIWWIRQPNLHYRAT